MDSPDQKNVKQQEKDEEDDFAAFGKSLMIDGNGAMTLGIPETSSSSSSSIDNPKLRPTTDKSTDLSTILQEKAKSTNRNIDPRTHG